MLLTVGTKIVQQHVSKYHTDVPAETTVNDPNDPWGKKMQQMIARMGAPIPNATEAGLPTPRWFIDALSLISIGAGGATNPVGLGEALLSIFA